MIANEVFQIPDDNPFQYDKLNRELIADNLGKIISSTTGSLVLSIDASWGNGKTTFIKMWRKKLDKTDSYRTLCFNAWENDDCEDPLLALIGEIEEVLIKEQEKPYIKKIKETGEKLLKKTLPTLIKIATHNALNIEDLNFDDSTKNHIVEGAGKLGEFEIYKEQKISKAKFREALTEYQKNENRKIIFFIDELDRCRPTFAIETLEKIKHLFNIDNFIFVLALDKNQLSHSIKTLYGQDMDSAGYLRRFIDIEFMLPEPNRLIYIDFLFARHKLRSEHTKHFEIYLKAVIESYNLSLRDIDKLFYCLSLILPTTHLLDEQRRYNNIYLEVLGAVYAIFPVLKMKDNKLYLKFVRKEPIDSTDLKKLHMPKRTGRYYNSIISQVIALNNMLRIKDDSFNQRSYNVGSDDSYREPEFDLLNLLDETQSDFVFIKHIEFTDNFTIPIR